MQRGDPVPQRLAALPNHTAPRILYVLTSPLAVRSFLYGQLRYMCDAGFEVFVASAYGKGVDRRVRAEGAFFQAIPFEREMSPRRDLICLWRLWKLMRRLEPDLVHVGTPKAGLLGGLAAWMSFVPNRVYTLYGLRSETARGGKRFLLHLIERLSCTLAHRVFCVSESLRRLAIGRGFVPASRCVVPAAGSPNGVDVERFGPTNSTRRWAARRREELRIPQTAPVIGFVGRLTRDKGVPELVESFQSLRDAHPELRLLLVGSFEKGDPIPQAIRSVIETDPRIVSVGFVDDPSPYYHLMTLLVLPSHREGFPTVALEAAAAHKPVVATAATGVTDAVLDGTTGILTPVGDVAALCRAMERILHHPAWASTLGRAGAWRARRDFQRQPLWDAIAGLYRDTLVTDAGGLPGARRQPLTRPTP